MTSRAAYHNNLKRHSQREFGHTVKEPVLAIPAAGETYRQKSADDLEFTVVSVHTDPNEPGAGHRKRPYMRVSWSDRPDTLETYALQSFTNDLGQGFLRRVQP